MPQMAEHRIKEKTAAAAAVAHHPHPFVEEIDHNEIQRLEVSLIILVVTTPAHLEFIPFVVVYDLCRDAGAFYLLCKQRLRLCL